MEYAYKYDLIIKLNLSEGVFAFITDAIKRNKETKHAIREGNYWDNATRYRKYGEITTATMDQLERIILKALKSYTVDYQLNQEAREYTIDLYNTLEKIYEDTILELKRLNDPDIKYTSAIRFI